MHRLRFDELVALQRSDEGVRVGGAVEQRVEFV